MERNKEGWIRVLFFIIPYIIVAVIFQLIGLLVVGADLTDFGNQIFLDSSAKTVVVMLFNLAGIFFILWAFMTGVDKEKFINLGLNIKNRLKDFIVGNTLGLVIIGFGFIILIGLNEIRFESINFNLNNFLVTVAIFSIVSISEEILFRGYILRNLMLSFNKYLALLISSLAFATLHLANPNVNLVGFINLILAGGLLGITYIHTKNLWFPIGLHFSWNFVQNHLGFNVSGISSSSLITHSINEPNNINGGHFGFEGSVILVLFQILAILAIEIYYNSTLRGILKFR
jgi:membrane protease YdiL (CAAX protease family)